MIKIQIKSVLGALLFEYEKENNTIKDTLLEAIKRSADLQYADLRSADLQSADLQSADLQSADLRSADLQYADLQSANLQSADLRYANLQYANLQYANLQYADLQYADLRSADLQYADLRSADLQSIKNDMWDVLLKAIPEIKNLKTALIDGKIDGSTYDGECACLCGTIEKSENKDISKRIHDQRDSNRPIELFFLAINKGDTPETSQFSKLILEWIEEFQSYIEQ